MAKTLSRAHFASKIEAALLVVASALWSAPARADLLGDGDALIASWRRSGATARRATTLFLEADDLRTVTVGKRPKGGCIRIVAIAERQLAFTLRPLAGTRVEESLAGVAQIEDCGRGPLRAGRVQLGMMSPRGTIDVLVVRYRAALAPVERVLPQRALGPAAPQGELGEPLELAPIAERAARAERIAKNEGSKGVVTVRARAGERGTGTMIMKLADGCHRLSVLADSGGSPEPIDIDAEVRHPTSDALLARDRSHAPDARLDFCLGESDRVELRFVGAGGPLPVTVLDAYWPIPAGIPKEWGSRARAGFAWALHRRRAPELSSPPVEQRVGIAGVTVIPLEVEPTACYIAAFASAQGDSEQQGRLTVRAGGVTRYDDADEEPFGAAVSFCAPDEADVARVQVELRARTAAWVLALWRVGP